MNGYVKVFSSILDSSVWQEDSDTRIVWITLLAMADKHGEVSAAIPGLAHRAGVNLESCEHALQVLQQPDKYSRTPDHEGRRIEVIDGGWVILNHAKYRNMMSEEDRRERDRIRKQRYRESLKCPTDVPSCPTAVGHSAHTDPKAHNPNPKTSLSEVPSDEESGSPVPPVAPKAKPQPSYEGKKLAALLQEEIRRNLPDADIKQSQLRNWAKTADKMIRLDGRTPEEIARLIQWAQRDSFWQTNILSMDKLRKQFDQLKLKSRVNGKAQSVSFASVDYTAGLERRADGSFAL